MPINTAILQSYHLHESICLKSITLLLHVELGVPKNPSVAHAHTCCAINIPTSAILGNVLFASFHLWSLVSTIFNFSCAHCGNRDNMIWADTSVERNKLMFFLSFAFLIAFVMEEKVLLIS